MAKHPTPPSKPAQTYPEDAYDNGHEGGDHQDKAVAEDKAPPEDAGPPTVNPDEAETLMRSGHKLYIKGESADHWMTVVKVGDGFALAVALTDDVLKDVLKHDLVLLP